MAKETVPAKPALLRRARSPHMTGKPNYLAMGTYRRSSDFGGLVIAANMSVPAMQVDTTPIPTVSLPSRPVNTSRHWLITPTSDQHRFRAPGMGEVSYPVPFRLIGTPRTTEVTDTGDRVYQYHRATSQQRSTEKDDSGIRSYSRFITMVYCSSRNPVSPKGIFEIRWI
jgi:hypothetical protein